MDLTDLDWSPELFLVCHDDDEQNARLAVTIWEANYLDVEKSYIEDLLPLLGMLAWHLFAAPLLIFMECLAHENRFVRESCAQAIAFALVHFPSTSATLMTNLKAMYQDKV